MPWHGRNEIGLAGTGNMWKNVVAVPHVIRPKMNRDKVITGPNPIWSIDQMVTPKANYTEPWQKQFTHTVVTCRVTRTLRQLSYQPHHLSACRDMNWKRKTVSSKVCRISVNGRNSLGIDKPLSWRRTTQANIPEIHHKSKPMVWRKYSMTWCNVGPHWIPTASTYISEYEVNARIRLSQYIY